MSVSAAAGSSGLKAARTALEGSALLARPLVRGASAEGARGAEDNGADVGAQPVTVIIVPGWRNSGPGHWQSLWAERIPGAIRVQQQDWAKPHRAAWAAAVQQAILGAPHSVVIAAHSLGCIASVHALASLPSEALARVAGALFVAPADPERRALFEDFSPVPAQPLPFGSIVAAGSNDPYCPIRMASAYAKSWASTFVRVPDGGHINIESGHGEWPLGWALLGALVAQAGVRAPIRAAA
ncbi:RBBP9/YdeN family alpha/beta hydrolase [Comamonas odontotermitis]|uniref:RBBP9/YdeN family alpha/beta hydrolase n=1 Tax=Comamonas odontotermitis TaxID=379895 RepID=UPI0037509E71